MKTRISRVVAVFLAVLMLMGAVVIPTSAASSSNSENTYQEILASLTAESYASYLAGAEKDNAKKGTGEISVDIFGAINAEKTDADVTPLLSTTVASFAGKNSPKEPTTITVDLLNLPDSGTVTWDLEISKEQAGLYGIRIEYVALKGSTSSIERKLFIDGSVPFDEARALALSKVWSYNYTKFEEGTDIPTFDIDAGNNDLRADISAYPVIRTYECVDIDGFYNEPFQFHFKEGKRTLSLVASKEEVAIKSITLFPVEESRTLDEMMEEWVTKYNAQPASKGSTIKFRAETPNFVSDKSVYPSNDRSSAKNSPINAFAQKINVIGASGYSTTGQWASYTFTVEETGIYNIVARFKQSALQGMFASRVVKLASSDGMYGYADGTPKAPYRECYTTRFDYSNDWCVEALNTGEDKLCFYFEEGVTYTLQMEVGLGELADLLNTIENSLTAINNSYLEILKLTGANPDEYRDYGFRRVMPQTIEQLGIQGEELANQAKELRRLCGTSGSNIATLENISRLLKRMYKDEDEIAPNLSNLKTYIGTLGTWINSAKAQSITVDYYMIASPDVKLPKANANIFQTIWYETKSFVASFFVQYDAMGVSDTSETTASIDVWLAYGRDQSQIWKNLITNSFSSQSMIAVDLKLVAAGTLLPSVLAGQGPDAYIGLDAASVINYAIRNAIVNVEDMPGFDQVKGYNYTTEVEETVGNYKTKVTKYYMKHADGTMEEVPLDEISFNDATMVPITLYGETYGLPEQANFPMMFYRRDILADLEIDVPQTWDDVLAAIPTLQSNNMMVGLTYTFATNMFLYQYGGNLWKYTDYAETDPRAAYAGAAIGLDDNVALDSFQFCCRLYTDYSFPTAFDGPNRFRTGEVPLLIADYCTTYNQLVVFATEIRGLWQFTSIPGIVQDVVVKDEYGLETTKQVLNNDTIVTVTATVMLHGCRDITATWEYMKWQAGGQVQSDYGNEMVALVGPAAKYATANLKGIALTSWSASERTALLEQSKHQAAIPNYPGSYIIARYTQFAFLAAYNDGKDPVVAIQDYINIINQELTRKREEFEQATLKTGQTPDEALKELENKE